MSCGWLRLNGFNGKFGKSGHFDLGLARDAETRGCTELCERRNIHPHTQYSYLHTLGLDLNRKHQTWWGGLKSGQHANIVTKTTLGLKEPCGKSRPQHLDFQAQWRAKLKQPHGAAKLAIRMLRSAKHSGTRLGGRKTGGKG